MMEWKKHRLGELALSIQTGPFGSQLHQADYSDSGIPVIMPKDMINGKVETNDIARVSDIHVQRLKRHKVKSGDIIYSRRGDVGRCSLITEREEGWLCGTGCLKVALDKSKCVPSFIAFILQRKDSIGWVENHAVGATMPNLNTGILSNLPLIIPTFEEQGRIASILSAYDNLIENNNRRIRLLEQMAENLYKEWFVRFRFPGHEKAEFENGLPKGWKRAPLKTICEFERGKNITASEMIAGNVPVISAGISPSGTHNKSNVQGTSVTVSSSGANAGFISIHYEDIWAAYCSYVSEKSTRYIYFVYEVLNNMRAVVDNLQRGAAQPHVYPKDLNRISIIVPDETNQDRANKKFSHLHKLKAKLLQQNEYLSRQRDLLLPRLMSGKLEVKV